MLPNRHPATRWLFVLALLAVGCSSVATSHDYDPEADFSALESYAWIAPPESGTAYPLVYKRVVASTDEVLGQKGFRLDPSAPDFRIAVHLSTKQKIRVTDWGYGNRSEYDAWDVHEIDVDEYDVGTLILDVVSAETNEVIWRGTARGTVNPTATPEKRTEKVRAAVKLLKRFPPPEE